MAGQKNTQPRRQARRDAAEQRQYERGLRGDAEQLALLQNRGYGSSPEADRLRERLGGSET